MPWTTPETFTAGQTLTAASMNIVSGNLDAIGGAWTAYTPTWTNLTIGNATQDSRYIKAGRLVAVNIKLTFGSTTSVSGIPEFTLPATMDASYSTNAIIGTVSMWDANVDSISVGPVIPKSGLAAGRVVVYQANGTYLGVGATSSTIPFTWATSDTIEVTVAYEAAS